MRPTSPIAQLLSSRSLAGAVEIGGHRQLEEVAALKPLGEEQDLEALDVPALRVEPRDDVVPSSSVSCSGYGGRLVIWRTWASRSYRRVSFDAIRSLPPPGCECFRQ